MTEHNKTDEGLQNLPPSRKKFLRRWAVKGLLLLSLLANIFFILGYYHAREGAGMAHLSRHERQSQFAQKMGFDETQSAALQDLKRQIVRDHRKMRRDNKGHHQDLVDALFMDPPDHGKIKTMLQQFAGRHADVTLKVTERFTLFVQTLSPEQKAKFRDMLLRRPGFLFGGRLDMKKRKGPFKGCPKTSKKSVE